MENNFDNIQKNIPNKILNKEFSDIEKNFVDRKVEENLVAAKNGLSIGDLISIINEDKDGKIKDEISLKVNKDSILEIKSGEKITEYTTELPYYDSRKGFDLNEIECATNKEGRIVRGNLNDIIKNETGIDLDYQGKSEQKNPIRFEAGGYIVRKRDEEKKLDVILKRKKIIYCREGKVHSLGVASNLPPREEYELLEEYHSHEKYNTLASWKDLSNFIKHNVPNNIYADNGLAGFTGIRYTPVKNIDTDIALKDINKIKEEHERTKDTSKYITQKKRVIREYFHTEPNHTFEKRFWTQPPSLKLT